MHTKSVLKKEEATCRGDKNDKNEIKKQGGGIMWAHLTQSLLRAFVAHRGWSLVKKSKKTKDQPITQRKKRGRKEVKKDKTNRARRRVKAKRSDVDLEFLTREFHPRIVPVEEERVQSDIKRAIFFSPVDALVTPSVD